MKVIVCKDYDAVSIKAAQTLTRQIIKNPDSVLGLATGGTPEGMYRQLVKYYQNGVVSFRRMKSVNLDEYVGLSPTHEESYAFYMNNNFFNHVDVDKNNTHFLNGLTNDSNAECQRYEQLIVDLGGIDFQLLGIGRNGHIGFNEPSGSFDGDTHLVTLNEQTCVDNARFFNNPEDVPKCALSMGLKSIMQSREILLLATGEAKAQAIAETVQGRIRPELPASVLQLHPCVTLLVDESAASLLTEGRYVLEKLEKEKS